MYYVYILQSQKDNSIYIGFTANLEQRLMHHNSGKSQYTKSKLPLELIYFEAYKNKKNAQDREYRLKNHGMALTQLKKRIGLKG